MKRFRWGFCVAIFGLIGCSEGPEGTIGAVRNQISAASSSVDTIVAKLKDFSAKKQGGDEVNAKADLKDAIEAAKTLKLAADKIQEHHYHATQAAASMTDDQKKAFKENNVEALRSLAGTFTQAATSHRELKKIVREITTKYGEDSLRDLMQEINAADNAFAAVARRK